MRTILLIIAILTISCSKFTRLEGRYFSNQQDCLSLDDDDAIVETKKANIYDGLLFKQTDLKLKFRSKANFFWRLRHRRRVDRFVFKIIHKTDDSFMVSPSSRQAKRLFNNRDSITFKTKYHFIDQTNYFKTIVYHSSHCYGCCSDLHLEIDYSGNLKVTDNGRGWLRGCPDSILNNNYFGKVSLQDLDRLKRILWYSQLKTLDWPDERFCVDAPDLTLIIHQNDTTYHFKKNAPCVPVISRELTTFLGRLFSYETLKKVDTTYVYEK